MGTPLEKWEALDLAWPRSRCGGPCPPLAFAGDPCLAVVAAGLSAQHAPRGCAVLIAPPPTGSGAASMPSGRQRMAVHTAFLSANRPGLATGDLQSARRPQPDAGEPRQRQRQPSPQSSQETEEVDFSISVPAAPSVVNVFLAFGAFNRAAPLRGGPSRAARSSPACLP